MDTQRHHYTRVCMLGAHDKCLGGWDHPVRGWTSCDCDCHEDQSTLFAALVE